MTNAQVHSWVEFYSPLYGFITADPTPATALPRILTQAETQETTSSGASSVSSSEAPSSSSEPSSSAEVSSAAPSSGSSESSAVSSPGATPGGGMANGDLSGYLIAVALAVLLLCLYGGKAAYRALWFAVVRRRSDRKLTLSLYRYFITVLAGLGFSPSSSSTPQELADMVRNNMRFGAVSFDRVTELYLEVRFGERELTGAEREELFAFYRALPAACRQKLGRLRYLLMYPILR